MFIAHSSTSPSPPPPAAAYDLSGESFNNAVESLLEDPQFLSAVEDEVGGGAAVTRRGVRAGGRGGSRQEV